MGLTIISIRHYVTCGRCVFNFKITDRMIIIRQHRRVQSTWLNQIRKNNFARAPRTLLLSSKKKKKHYLRTNRMLKNCKTQFFHKLKSTFKLIMKILSSSYLRALILFQQKKNSH